MLLDFFGALGGNEQDVVPPNEVPVSSAEDPLLETLLHGSSSQPAPMVWSEEGINQLYARRKKVYSGGNVGREIRLNF